MLQNICRLVLLRHFAGKQAVLMDGQSLSIHIQASKWRRLVVSQLEVSLQHLPEVGAVRSFEGRWHISCGREKWS